MTDTPHAGPANGAGSMDGGGAQEKAQQVAGQAQDKAQDIAGQAQEKVQQAAGQARGRVADLVDQRSTKAGEQVSQQAGDLRSVAEQLREQGQDGPAKVAEQAAQRAERAGRYLTESDADRILGDIEDLGRRIPWAIALGGLALGFAVSRFLKASSRERYGSATAQRAQPRGDLPAQTGAGAGHGGPGYGTAGITTPAPPASPSPTGTF